MTDDDHYITGEGYESDPCPPHLLVLCAFCGQDTCDDCGLHFIDDEEVDECPALTDTLLSLPPGS